MDRSAFASSIHLPFRTTLSFSTSSKCARRRLHPSPCRMQLNSNEEKPDTETATPSSSQDHSLPNNSTPHQNEDSKTRPWWRRVLEDDQFDDLRTFTIAFGMALLVRVFVVEPRYIPSLSMYPTFDIGDQFLVDKLSKHVRHPQSGDIVVFEPPQALQERGYRKKDAFIKRVVAKGGDTVRIHDGKVEVNGIARSEPFINDQPNYEWGPSVVPDGFVMVLGDNRNNSYDSHIWGFLPMDNIIGRAAVRYWPPARFGASFL